MPALLRFTILGTFVAAGVGIAISVAAHMESSPAESAENFTPPGETDMAIELAPVRTAELALTEEITKLEPKPESETPATQEPEEPKPLPEFAVPPERNLNPQPVPAPHRDPVADHITYLQQRLSQVEKAATETRLAQLEAKLDQLDNAQHKPDPRPPAPEPQPTADDTAPTSTITKGEGDDRLTLDLHDMDLRLLLDYLSREGDLNILAGENVRGSVTARLTNVDLPRALDAILHATGYVARRQDGMVYVGTPDDIQRMDELRDKIETRIYRLNYVTSLELQKLIAPLLSRNGVVTVSSPAQVDIEASTTKTGGDSFAGNDTLIVRDYELVLKKIDDLVAKVDQRPRQIAIEAMVLSVSLDDGYDHGVDFEFLRLHDNVRLVSGSPLTTLGQIDVSGAGIKFGFLDGDIGSFINALETIGDTNVVAAPHLVCLNRQRAEIQIGDQKGFLSTTQTETATTQTVEFLDLGTLLRIRPFISSDGMIRLEVHPELSTGDVKLVGEFALPEKSVTQVTTNVMCRDGCTVVIGGLIREEVVQRRSMVPVVGHMPVLGTLFTRKSEEVTRNEIVVLITPKIIDDPGACVEGKPCLTDITRRQSPLHVDKMTKIARRHYGRRYYHQALAAWNAGNMEAALQYLDLSLQFYPNNHDALNLHERITTGDYRGEPAEIIPPDTYQPMPLPAELPVPDDGDLSPSYFRLYDDEATQATDREGQ